jgi:hypothetical protein
MTEFTPAQVKWAQEELEKLRKEDPQEREQKAREWAKLVHRRLHETYPGWPCTDEEQCAVAREYSVNK